MSPNHRVAAATRFTISATDFHFFRMAGFLASFAAVNGWLRESEEEAGEGAEEVAEDLDGAEMLGHDFVEHAVEFGHVHAVHGGLDATFDVEFLDDGLGADVADHPLDAGADGGDRLRDPLPRGIAAEEARGGGGEGLAQVGAQVVLELGAEIARETADALGAFGRLASVGKPEFARHTLCALGNLLSAADDADLDATGAFAEELIARETAIQDPCSAWTHHHHDHDDEEDGE